MKVVELIHVLAGFYGDAEVSVIAHNKKENFSITWGGGGEGEMKEDCREVGFYVDRLCQSESKT